jgi:hypothetical protein
MRLITKYIHTAFFLLPLVLIGCTTQQKHAEPEVVIADAAPNWIKAQTQGYEVIELNNVQTAQQGLEQTDSMINARLSARLLSWVEPQIALRHFDSVLLEHRLRNKILSELQPVFKVEVTAEDVWFDEDSQRFFARYADTPETLETALLTHLTKLDAQLADYKHASYLGSELDQLFTLVPVLPTLEQYRVTHMALLDQFGRAPVLPHALMADAMENQITRLFNAMNISMDALTAETEQYEHHLSMALTAAGFNVSARRPSLMVRYYIEQYVEPGLVELVNDIELNHRDASRFDQFSEGVLVEGEQGDGVAIAYAQLAEALVALVLNRMHSHIRDFNVHRFGRE